MKSHQIAKRRRENLLSMTFEEETEMDTKGNWILRAIDNGSTRYLEYIDYTKGKFSVRLTDDMGKALRYPAKVRAIDEAKFLNALGDSKNRIRTALERETGSTMFFEPIEVFI